MKRIIILLAILTILVSCEKENVNDAIEPCTCIKLYLQLPELLPKHVKMTLAIMV